MEICLVVGPSGHIKRGRVDRRGPDDGRRRQFRSELDINYKSSLRFRKAMYEDESTRNCCDQTPRDASACTRSQACREFSVPPSKTLTLSATVKTEKAQWHGGLSSWAGWTARQKCHVRNRLPLLVELHRAFDHGNGTFCATMEALKPVARALDKELRDLLHA